MSDWTTLSVRKETRERVLSLQDEGSQDDAVRRLLDAYEDGNESPASDNNSTTVTETETVTPTTEGDTAESVLSTSTEDPPNVSVTVQKLEAMHEDIRVLAEQVETLTGRIGALRDEVTNIPRTVAETLRR